MIIEVSNGELLDKVSILEIKLKLITNEAQLKNIQAEYDHLNAMAKILLVNEDAAEFYRQLTIVNERLWEIEDAIRLKEHNQQFDNEFIELARSVYFTNDNRSAIKKAINNCTGSTLVEEKSYQTY